MMTKEELRKQSWNYIGVKLTPESKEKLLSMFGSNIPTDWKTYCDHLTLAYNNGTELPQSVYDYYSDRFGEEVSLIITKMGASDRAMAMGVKYGDKIVNAHPHITLAVAPSAKPVESNYITEWNDLVLPVRVNGVITCYAKNR